MEKQFAVYMLASGRNGTLYIGVTSNLIQRTWQHREGFVEGFAERYAVAHLVWYELHDDALSAITRENSSSVEAGVENRTDRVNRIGTICTMKSARDPKGRNTATWGDGRAEF